MMLVPLNTANIKRQHAFANLSTPHEGAASACQIIARFCPTKRDFPSNSGRPRRGVAHLGMVVGEEVAGVSADDTGRLKSEGTQLWIPMGWHELGLLIFLKSKGHAPTQDLESSDEADDCAAPGARTDYRSRIGELQMMCEDDRHRSSAPVQHTNFQGLLKIPKDQA
jgi:hypothetical protein